MNYYELLEVSQNASKEVIRAAYKSLMQRYHPDKNPDNAEIASRAALLVQAYDVLSDSDKRSAYDLQIKSQPEIRTFTPTESSDNVKPYRKNHVNQKIAAKNQISWYPWIIISVIILSGGLILSLSKKQAYPLEDSHLTAGGRFPQKNNPAVLEHPSKSNIDITGLTTGEKEILERPIPLLAKTLTVNLKFPDKPLETSEHVLSIPILLVKVGSFDSEKFIQYLDSRKDSINLQLAEKLAYAKHEELIKVGGERYLKKLIVDTLRDITGTSRLEYDPSAASESLGRHGITEVFLPESFSVK
jgi:hypothetical protein